MGCDGRSEAYTWTCVCTRTHTQHEACSEVLFVEVEFEVFTLSLDDFGESRRAAVKHVDFPFFLLGHFLKQLVRTHTHAIINIPVKFDMV